MDGEAITSHGVLERVLLDESAEPTQLPLSLLESITNRFSPDHQIGIGGFAVVYKGMTGKGVVAVKKLSNTLGIHENNFHEEVKCMIKAKHKNIVRFLGYCADTQGKMEIYEGELVMADQRNWLLCFEYACNSSLDTHITDASFGLNWRVRYRIIRGICEGLLFLHEKRILHLDLKPANILLDGHMVPKICDFGLSRCLGEEHTRVITKSRCGTLAYMDPEYLRSGRITFASDIYSLGIIILEILTGVKCYLEEENVVAIWTNRLEASERDSERDLQLEQVRVCTKIGIECMNLDPKKRPVAQHIIDTLDKTASADYLYEIGTTNSSSQLHVSLPREQTRERFGELITESLPEVDVEENHEKLENSLWGLQDKKQQAEHYGVRIFSYISSVFNKLSNLDIFNRKAPKGLDRNSIQRILEHSDTIKIFRKDELEPILYGSILIGKGLCTEVYKGMVDNTQVAVQKYCSVIVYDRFVNNVIILSQLTHKNIVRLIGCCLEMDSPILVYEHIPGGKLHDILHNDSKVPLSLDVRLTIAAELAQGLAYLHTEASIKILHLDFSPARVLLDHNFVPKISGFGTSRLFVRDQHYIEDVTGGDMNYMDPVFYQTGLLTNKSDVYSFGIVILELISRKKSTAFSDENNMVKSFLELHEHEKEATELFDKEVALTTGDLEILDSLAEIAVHCLNLDVDTRPTMAGVADHLLFLLTIRRKK